MVLSDHAYPVLLHLSCKSTLFFYIFPVNLQAEIDFDTTADQSILKKARDGIYPDGSPEAHAAMREKRRKVHRI